jgi:hypothetical protein
LIKAFSLDAILVMLTDSMLPVSLEYGGKDAGLSLVIGFNLALAMTLYQMR